MENRRRLTVFLATLFITSIASVNAVPFSNLLAKISHPKRDNSPWPYAVVGDSWGSGVAYKTEVLYDNNKDKCLRTKESHGPQIESDDSWNGHGKSTLNFAACSGSTLGDIVLGGNQIGKVGRPNVLIMTSGGNQAGFGHIVEVCIYHPTFYQNYGPAYKDDKDRKGECAVALDGAKDYITDPKRMETDLRITIDDIYNNQAVSDDTDFLLYLTGYARFWGTDLDDWCNKEAWNVPGISPTPYLSKELRKTFNDHVDKVNDLYKKVANDKKYSKHTRYIDLDSQFSGHRFCEPGATYQDQVNHDTNFEKVYLWNLNYPWQIANNTVTSNTDISQDQANMLFSNGNGVTAWSGSGSQGGNEPENGWRLRPFHPRTSGYTKIKDAIFAQMKKDKVPPK